MSENYEPNYVANKISLIQNFKKINLLILYKLTKIKLIEVHNLKKVY